MCVVVSLRRHNRQCIFSRLTLPSLCTSSTFRVLVCLPLFGRLLAICVVSPPPPPNNKMCTPLLFYQHLFSLHHPFTPPHFTQPPVTQPHLTQPLVTQVVLCAVHPTPRQHPCYPPTMSHSKPFSPLTPIITPTLHDHPRTNLVPWKIAINRSVRAVFAEWDRFGFLFGVCDDTVWAVLNTPPGGQLQARPKFPAPAALAAGDGPAVRDAPRMPGHLGCHVQLFSVQRS